MSGYYSSLAYDPQYIQEQEQRNNIRYDYVLNRSAVMRNNVVRAPMLGLGQNATFVGPMAGSRVTLESFLTGRGHTLSKNPGCGVYYLPSSVLSGTNQEPQVGRIDLQPLQTRTQPSCNGLRETVITPYNFFPENYKNGYMGMDSVATRYSRISRELPNVRDPCSQTYATYDPKPFIPYQ